MGRPGSKQSMGRDSAEAVLVYTHSVAPAMPPALEVRGHGRVARSHGVRPGGSLLSDPPHTTLCRSKRRVSNWRYENIPVGSGLKRKMLDFDLT